MSKSNPAPTGVLIIDKPAGPTSHDIVARIRKIIRNSEQVGLPAEARYRRAKVGHSGTLDPFATGILIIAMGSATRLLEYTGNLPKTYVAEIVLGAVSDTDDVTGIVNPANSVNPACLPDRQVKPAQTTVEKVLQTFIGQQQQIPPAYAAIKVAGRKLYEYARGGEEVPRKARIVTIHSLKLQDYNYPSITIETTVSSGTYIRALARDIGAKLGTGAYTKNLRRTAIGTFTEQKSNKLEELEKNSLQQYLIPPNELVKHLPSITLTDGNVAKFKQGKALRLSPAQSREAPKERSGISEPLAIFDQSKTLIGIAAYDPSNSLLSPKKVLT